MATKPTLVMFVRHGTTGTTGKVLPGRTPGVHLAEKGRQQAEAAAERIAAAGAVAAVYASPMERTRETAAPIARAVKRRVRVDRGLIEADFGRWTGRRLAQLRKLRAWSTVQRHPSGFRFPGGESFPEMQTRMVDTVRRLCATHPGESIVVVSHADTIKAALADALGTHLDLFQRIVVSPCSVSTVVYGEDGPVVLNVNTTSGPIEQAGVVTSAWFEFDALERFTTGAIGPKGERVFYLQAVSKGEVVALRLEKQQVLALAEYLGGVLDDLKPTELHDLPDDLDMIDPVVAEWVVSSIGVAYAESDDRIVIWTEELIPDDAEGEPATARFRLTREQVTAFITRARELVASGRPPCPYCGRPLDGDGSWCPCAN